MDIAPVQRNRLTFRRPTACRITENDYADSVRSRTDEVPNATRRLLADSINGRTLALSRMPCFVFVQFRIVFRRVRTVYPLPYRWRRKFVRIVNQFPCCCQSFR